MQTIFKWNVLWPLFLLNSEGCKHVTARGLITKAPILDSLLLDPSPRRQVSPQEPYPHFMNQIWGQIQAGPIRFTPETQSPQSWVPAMAVFCGEGGRDGCPWFSLNQPSCNTFCVPMSQVLSDTTSFNYDYLHISDRGNWGKEWAENLLMITQLASWRVGIWTQTGFGSRDCALTMLWWAQHSVVLPTLSFLLPGFHEILQYPTQFLLLFS